jgi:hypothetical protein
MSRRFDPNGVGKNSYRGRLPVRQIRNLADLEKYDALSTLDRRRTYNNVMSSDDRKRIGELCVFRGFVNASNQEVHRSSVVCLDPPWPDIGCRLSSFPYLFELGEVTDQELARRYSGSLRTMKITGGWFSQDEPLKSIIASKTQKAYETGGVPVGLLLYWWKQEPYYPAIQQALIELRNVINYTLSSGPFSTIWLYKHPERVLASFRGEQ